MAMLCPQGAMLGRLGRSASSLRMKSSGASGSSNSATLAQRSASASVKDSPASRRSAGTLVHDDDWSSPSVTMGVHSSKRGALRILSWQDTLW